MQWFASLCRLAFEFGIWSEGAMPPLFVCEQAHRYAAAGRSVGFTPTRRAMSKIAREGRKHGVYLGLVTQRPAELDPTIISQCSTLFALRMANQRDQDFLAAAVSDAENLLAFVPLLATGEAIAFGEGVPLPARMRFRELPAEALPRSDSFGRGLSSGGAMGSAFVGAVVERWRGATMNKVALERDTISLKSERDVASDTGINSALAQAHSRLLRTKLEPSSEAGPTNSLWQSR